MKKQLSFIVPFLLLFGSYASASNLLWAKTLNGNTTSGYFGVLQTTPTADGNMLTLVGGNNVDTLDADLGTGLDNVATSPGATWQYALIKYDPTGNVLWHKTWVSDGSNTMWLRSFAERPSDGHIFLYGVFNSDMDADPDSGFALINSNSSSLSAFSLIEVDGSGNYVWAGSLPTNHNGLSNGSIRINSSGNIVVTGSFEGDLDIDPSFSGTNTIGTITNNNSQPFIVVYDANHNVVWGHTMVTSAVTNYSTIDGFAINPNNNDIYLAGQLYGTVSLNLITGSGNNVVYPSNAGPGIYMAHYDSSGNYINSLVMGTNTLGFTDIESITFINGFGGEILLAGSTTNTLNLDPNGAGYNVVGPTNTNYHHGFVARYDLQLGYKWATAFTSSSNRTRIFNPHFDPSVGLYMIVSADTTYDVDPGTDIVPLVASNSSAIVVLDYFTGNYVTNLNFGTQKIYPQGLNAVNGKILMYAGYANGANADLNGGSTILNNQYDSQNQYDSYVFAEYDLLAIKPITQVSNIHFTASTDSSVKVAFTKGSGQKRLVMVQRDTVITDVPANGDINFFYDTIYGLGYVYANGAHGVYLDSGQVFTLSGIDTTGGHKYYFTAFELNGGPYASANFLTQNAPTAVYPITHIDSIPTGISETMKLTFALYPNPTTGYINVQTNQALDEHTRMTVMDVNGKILLEQKAIVGTNQTINVSELSSGIYFVQLLNAQGVSTAKFVKE